MSDIHDTKDLRNIKINNVGICDYKVSFTLKNKKEKYITIATVKSGVSLDKDTKGAHLSRIVQVIDKEMTNKELTLTDISKVCKKLSSEVGVDNANISLVFETVFNVMTPKSNNLTNLFAKIELYYRCEKNNITDSHIKITANGAMLCPNSKAKSRYGAHSQKCDISATLYGDFNNIDLKKISLAIANSTSAPVFGVVRSADEVYMTELAYDNPKFSEDAVRDTLIAVKKIYKNGDVAAELVNYESIHQHNVFCESDTKC